MLARLKFSPGKDTIESVGMEDNDVLPTNYSMKFNISDVNDEDLCQYVDCSNNMINIKSNERTKMKRKNLGEIAYS